MLIIFGISFLFPFKKCFIRHKMRTIFIGVVLFGLVSCSKITVENPTDKFQKAKKLVELKNKKLSEISGGAASINNSKLFWLHNDSGNDPEIFLVNDQLKVLLTCKVKDIENRDWEDIAVGPGPERGKNYVYIGEIGDNESKYSLKYIYRFEEPTWDGKANFIEITKFDTITFKLPDKKKGTETLLLDPATKNIFVISKREEPVWVYKLTFPQSTKDTLTAEKVISLPFTQIVGGDISSDGSILLKNYEHVFYWENEKGKKPIDMILKEKPFEVPYELEPQGEAILWTRDNSGFYTVSEKNVGKNTYLYFYQAKVK
jgi:hypothetical protein